MAEATMGRGPGSSRDELMWVVIHLCMEATLGISLYSYFYLKLAKNTMSFLLSLMFSLQQNWRTRGQNRFCLESRGWGEWCPKQFIPVSKYKNDKIKKNKIKFLILSVFILIASIKLPSHFYRFRNCFINFLKDTIS
jgi:hypothetical protein